MRLLTVFGTALIWSCASGTTDTGTGGSTGTGTGTGTGPGCTLQTWYRDSDGDGFGNDEITEEACEQPDGFTDQGGDCDDTRSFVYPGAEEDCTSDSDLNCDGSSGYDDADMDGVPACEDCDDSKGTVYPGADEICDGVDNDCDMLVDLDDEPAEELCAAPSNTTASCDAGLCLFDCTGDFFDVDQDMTNGCECEAQPAVGLGESCANAIDLGNLTDSMMDSVTVSGNAPEAGRATWYAFTAIDDLDTNGDEYHVDGRFTTNPGTAYTMAVYHSGCPGNGGTELTAAETDAFDWYTDFNRTTTGCTLMSPCGEGDCTTAGGLGINECDDDTKVFYVEVKRVDGQPSCDTYDLQLSNGVY